MSAIVFGTNWFVLEKRLPVEEGLSKLFEPGDTLEIIHKYFHIMYIPIFGIGKKMVFCAVTSGTICLQISKGCNYHLCQIIYGLMKIDLLTPVRLGGNDVVATGDGRAKFRTALTVKDSTGREYKYDICPACIGEAQYYSNSSSSVVDEEL